MVFAIDTRMLHLAGDLLARGSGVFTGEDARALVDAAVADKTIPVEELAGLFLVHTTVEPIADERAAQVFAEVVDAGNRRQPELGPWLAGHYLASVLQAGAKLIAGRGNRHLGPETLSTWLAEVHQAQLEILRRIGTDDAVAPGSLERACLAVAELWHDHVTPAVQHKLDAMLYAWRAAGLTIGSDSAGAPPSGAAVASSSSPPRRELVGSWEYSSYVSAGGLSISRVRVLELRQDGRFEMSSDVAANMAHRNMCGDETGRTFGSAAAPDSRGRWAADGKSLRLEWDGGGESVFDYEADAEGMLLTPVASTRAEPTFWKRLG